MNNLKVLCLLLTTLLAISTKGADALVSKYLTTVEYISSKKVILNVYKEVTVYNERGRNLSNFIVSYDPDKPIKKMSAQLLDGNGKLVKSYKMKDIHDISAYTESTLFHEFRHKQIEVIYPSYPYTAILEYSQEYNEFISLPGWFPQEDYGIGVLYASYSVIYNNQTPIRFMHDNLGDPVKSEPKEGVFQLFWEIKNAPPLEKEPFRLRYPGQPLAWLWFLSVLHTKVSMVVTLVGIPTGAGLVQWSRGRTGCPNNCAPW